MLSVRRLHERTLDERTNSKVTLNGDIFEEVEEKLELAGRSETLMNKEAFKNGKN